LDEAMAKVVSESGTSFDPRVVRALEARYVELESRASLAKTALQPVLSTDLKITRGSAPAAGFEREDPETLLAEASLVDLAERVGTAVRFDALTYHVCLDRVVRRVFTAGDVQLLPDCLEVPIGQGLTGWVAGARKPILNGNPAVEPARNTVRVQSALAMPAAGGVLTLYRLEKDAFCAKELAALAPIANSLVTTISAAAAA
jgi:hypothetical protein